MGGNLVLAKEQGLQSDVATLMSALQAQVGITSVDREDLRYVHPLATAALALTHPCLCMISPIALHSKASSLSYLAIMPFTSFWTKHVEAGAQCSHWIIAMQLVRLSQSAIQLAFCLHCTGR